MNPFLRFTATVITVMLLFPSVIPAQRDMPADRYKLTDIRIPERSDAGVWDGTWFYVSRDQKIALWIRTEKGLPEIKLQFFGYAMAENFETDWKGRAEYVVKGRHPGRFELSVEERDENTISGSMEWTLEIGESVRTETGDFTIYRAGYGRSIVMRFDDYKRVVTTGKERKIWQPQQYWTFRKASKRLVLWEELPF
jgi:hypothetical protein